MRLAFLGSPEFAVPALTALYEAGQDIACVYTQPPRRAGRGQRVQPCAVHAAATALGLPVRTPARLRHDVTEHAYFAALALDAAVVAAYGLLLPQPMLSAPVNGCLNIHASLLPRWRGASPIQAAILAGDAESGVTIMHMEEGLDTGPILAAKPTALGPRVTTPELHDRLAAIGAALIVETLRVLPPATPQADDGVTYAPKLRREDGKLDWTLTAAALDAKIRALNPWPGTFCGFVGDTLKVLAAEPEPADGPPGVILDARFTVACGKGALRLTRVQRPGRPATDGESFLRGFSSWQARTLD